MPPTNVLRSGYRYRRTRAGNAWPGNHRRKSGYIVRACRRARWNRTRMARRTISAQRIEYDFDAAGDSQLVEDPEKIILYRMLAQRESMRDLAIIEPLGHAVHYVEFACRTESFSSTAGKAQGNRVRNGFQQVVKFTVACPDLTAMNTEDALGEKLERLGAEEKAAGAGTEGLDDCGPLRRIQ